MLHRPIAIFGHMTSLCLEEEVWQWLHEIATATKMSRRQLIERIAAGKGRRSLASACRTTSPRISRAMTRCFGQPGVW